MALVLVAALAIRAVLPMWITRYVNDGLAHMGPYQGRIASVDLHLWRGTCSVDDLVIEKRNGRVSVPLLHAPRADLAIRWADVFADDAVAAIEIQSPEINLVNGASSASTQYGAGVDWRAQIEALLPGRLGEIRVHDGRAHVRDLEASPPIDLQASHIDGAVLDLTQPAGAKRAGSLTLDARMLGSANVNAQAQFDTGAPLSDFAFVAKGSALHLRDARRMLAAYAALDVESGTADFVMHLDAKNGRLTGSATPTLHDVKMTGWKRELEERHANPFRFLRGFIAAHTVLDAHEGDALATRITIDGAIGSNRKDAVEEIVSVLHAAFAAPLKASSVGAHDAAEHR